MVQGSRLYYCKVEMKNPASFFIVAIFPVFVWQTTKIEPGTTLFFL
jgi:hypothetical protein